MPRPFDRLFGKSPDSPDGQSDPSMAPLCIMMSVFIGVHMLMKEYSVLQIKQSVRNIPRDLFTMFCVDMEGVSE